MSEDMSAIPAAPPPLRTTAGSVILHGVSWDFYEHLLRELGDSPGTRVTYDGGELQIMVASAGYDKPNRTLAMLVEIAAEESGTDLCRMGSTTFRREDLLQGFEPDSCFHFGEAAARMRTADEVDLHRHPAPDLVIEVDVTRDSLHRFPIFAAVGVGEVWRYSDGTVTMFVLRGGSYEHGPASAALTAEAATRFVEASTRQNNSAWLRGERG